MLAGLLRTAIRCDDPVLFLEHKHLYRETVQSLRNIPAPTTPIPFGKARDRAPKARTSRIITYGALVHRAEVAAAQLEPRRHSASKSSTCARSLRTTGTPSPQPCEKTNRVIVAHEDMLSWGYGAEIAARIADELFDGLDAPVQRVAAMDTFCAYNPTLEDVILPQTAHLIDAVKQLLEY